MTVKTMLGCILLAAAGSGIAATPDPLARLGWLQGCWAAQGAEAGSVEYWSAPAGGTMIGLSRTVKNGKTATFEFLHIREVEPGLLAYIAQPSGRPPTTFKLLRSSDTEWVFEDLAHDFPQRIIYRRDGEQAISARIEGVSKGKLKGIDYPMTRIGCDPT